jgi:hypothetical protein
MKSKFKPLPRSTRLIVEFHDGIHSTYTTKGDILKQNVFNPRAMSLSLINALADLEADRKADFDKIGTIVTTNAIGYVTGVDGKQHTYTLDISAYRIGGK